MNTSRILAPLNAVPNSEWIIPMATQEEPDRPCRQYKQPTDPKSFTTNANAWHALCVRDSVNPSNPMKNQTVTPENFESTYAMLVRSEEKERSVSESAVYLLFILSAVFSIFQVAQQPVVLPTSLTQSAPFAQTAPVQPRSV